MRLVEIALGVPKLGILREFYDLDDARSCEALDKNVANGCALLAMNHVACTDEQAIEVLRRTNG